MKQVNLLWIPLFLYMSLLSYTDVSAQSKLTGLWICEIQERSNEEAYENSYLWKLKIEKDGTFLYGEGYKRYFVYEDRIGLYLYAQKEGNYNYKDSVLTLIFNNSPVAFDYGPIFTSDHGKSTRNFALEERFPPYFRQLKEITNKWIERVSQKPFEMKINLINDQEMVVSWEHIDNEGKTRLIQRTFNKTL